MLYRLKKLWGEYPTQFWLMFVGMFVSTVGSSMIWPFLMIFVTKRLNLPLTTAASLMSLNSAVALASAFLAGPVIDRVGRKWMMVISLLGIGLVYLFYTQANSYLYTAILMSLTGLFNPLYRVGADAMVADLIPPEKRADAYAMTRMANNLGIAIGPAIGGLAAATSYTYAFLGGASGMIFYSILVAVFARETLQHKSHQPTRLIQRTSLRARLAENYGRVFADRAFMYFIIAFTMNQVCAALVWVLLGVHSNKNYGVSESLYGFIPMTNALMVVLFQAIITRFTRRQTPLPVLALGSLFYTVAVTSIAFGRGFWGFWLSMVIMTVGELLLMPTATSYTANLAPVDMRGRYMSIFSLTWGIAQGVGPVAGGYLSDNLGIAAPWLGGGMVGLLAVTAFITLGRRRPELKPELTV
jgi:MFS family permease